MISTYGRCCTHSSMLVGLPLGSSLVVSFINQVHLAWFIYFVGIATNFEGVKFQFIKLLG